MRASAPADVSRGGLGAHDVSRAMVPKTPPVKLYQEVAAVFIGCVRRGLELSQNERSQHGSGVTSTKKGSLAKHASRAGGGLVIAFGRLRALPQKDARPVS